MRKIKKVHLVIMGAIGLTSLACLADQFVLNIPEEGVMGYSVEGVSISINKAIISLGDAITATWSVIGRPEKVSISGYGDVSGSSGSVTFTPGNVQTISVTATANGVSMTKSTPITLLAMDLNNVTMTLDKTSFYQDDSVTITWDASALSLDSVVLTGVGTVSSKGSITIKPGMVSDISLQITKDGITKTKSIPVSVQAFSIGNISFSSDKTSYLWNDNVTVTWAITGGHPSSVSIAGIGVVSSSGTQTFKPGKVSSIDLTVQAGAQSQTKSIAVSQLDYSSCLNIYNSGGNLPSGIYSLNVNSKLISTYCDMTAGWTLVMRGKGGNTAGWITTAALNASFAGIAASPTGNTFKFADADINAIRGSSGMYRLISDGNISRTRYFPPSVYAHTRPKYGGDVATVSYATTAYAGGRSANSSLLSSGKYYGLTDDQGCYSAYFTTASGWNNWMIGDGLCHSGASPTTFCGGDAAGCNMAMWVK